VSPRSSNRDGAGRDQTPGGVKQGRGLPKDERLLLRGEFKRASAVGARMRSPHFIVYLANNQLGRRRLGITVSRKVGNAVVRNRVKRIVREYFRSARERLPDSRDYVVIARRGAGPMSLSEVGQELDKAIIAGRGKR